MVKSRKQLTPRHRGVSEVRVGNLEKNLAKSKYFKLRESCSRSLWLSLALRAKAQEAAFYP